MDPANSGPPAAALATLTALIALGLAWRQWNDRAAREVEPAREDLRYYRGQDARRFVGAGLMLLVAAGLVLGTQLTPGTARAPNYAWFAIWTAVSLMLLALLGLALGDWTANRAFARRQRRTIAAERRKLLEDEVKRLAESRRRDSQGWDGPNGVPHVDGPGESVP